jgi:hypothetical protein
MISTLWLSRGAVLTKFPMKSLQCFLRLIMMLQECCWSLKLSLPATAVLTAKIILRRPTFLCDDRSAGNSGRGTWDASEQRCGDNKRRCGRRRVFLSIKEVKGDNWSAPPQKREMSQWLFCWILRFTGVLHLMNKVQIHKRYE